MHARLADQLRGWFLAGTLACGPLTALAQPNPVSIWNEIAVATAALPPAPSGATPSERVAGPDVATVHLAIYDAVMAIARTHKPYAVQPKAPAAGASMDAAAIEAAYRTLKGLFPSRGDKYEVAYANGIAAIPDGDAKARGQAIGAEVATGMLALRANDGREIVLPPYVPGTAPGQFRGTNPILRVAQHTKPFATESHAQFRTPMSPALDSERYADDLAEVQAIASAASSSRSAAQTEVARFHTEPPGPYWSRNLRRFATASPDLAVNARLMAMLWTAYQDAVGGCFESKYHYNYWRPISAIQLGAQPDAAWSPHVPTPNHPEYPAAHSCASAAVAETLAAFHGTRTVRFEFNSTVAGTVPHLYERVDDLVEENANARVWGGMHFRNSTTEGAKLGASVARWVAAKHFRPVAD